MGVGLDSRLNTPRFIVMECADESLEGYLTPVPDDTRSLTLFEFRSYAEDILSALAFLHAMRPPRVHCDIKPGNILVFNHGAGVPAQLKLGDVGGCVSVGSHPKARSAYYASKDPDAEGAQPFMDVFSLGIVMCELALARLTTSVTDRHLAPTVDFPVPRRDALIATAVAKVRRFSPELADILLRCCAPAASDRITSKDALFAVQALKVQPMVPPPDKQCKYNVALNAVVNRDGSIALCRETTCQRAVLGDEVPEDVASRKVKPTPYCASCHDSMKMTRDLCGLSVSGRTVGDASTSVGGAGSEGASVAAAAVGAPAHHSDGDTVSASTFDLVYGAKPVCTYTFRPTERGVYVSEGGQEPRPAQCKNTVDGKECGKFVIGGHVHENVITGTWKPAPYCSTCYPAFAASTDGLSAVSLGTSQLAPEVVEYHPATNCVTFAGTDNVAECATCKIPLVGDAVAIDTHGVSPGQCKRQCLLHYREPKYELDEARMMVIDRKTSTIARCLVKGCGVMVHGDTLARCLPQQRIQCRANCADHYVRFDRDHMCILDGYGGVAACQHVGCRITLVQSEIDVVKQQTGTKPFCKRHYEPTGAVKWTYDGISGVQDARGILAKCMVCRMPLTADAVNATQQSIQVKPYCMEHYIIPTPQSRTSSSATASHGSRYSSSSGGHSSHPSPMGYSPPHVDGRPRGHYSPHMPATYPPAYVTHSPTMASAPRTAYIATSQPAIVYQTPQGGYVYQTYGMPQWQGGAYIAAAPAPAHYQMPPSPQFSPRHGPPAYPPHSDHRK